MMPATNDNLNLDFSIFKNFRMGESRRIQVRADFFNLFNHPQYIPGSPNDIQPVPTVGVGQVNTVTAATISLSNPSLLRLIVRTESSPATRG